MKYIDIEKFVADFKKCKNGEEMSAVSGELFQEFENCLHDTMDWDHEKEYKELHIHFLKMMIDEVNKFQKPTPKISKSIINLKEAMQDTIDDITKDAKVFKNMKY